MDPGKPGTCTHLGPPCCLWGFNNSAKQRQHWVLMTGPIILLVKLSSSFCFGFLQVAPGRAEDPRAALKRGQHAERSSKGSLKDLAHAAKHSSMGQLASIFSAHPVTAGVGSGGGGGRVKDTEAYWQKTLSLRNTSIALEDILQVSRLGGPGSAGSRL